MPFIGSQITVNNTGLTVLVTGDGSSNDPVPAVITNQDTSASVFLGGSGVSSTGYELKAGASLPLTAMPGEVLYGYASGSVRVDVLTGRQ